MAPSAKLTETFEDAEEENPVDHDGHNMQRRIAGQKQKRRIAGIEQQADKKCGFTSSAGKKSQRNKNSDGNSIDRQHRAYFSFSANSGHGQADGQHERRAGKDQHGIDRGESGNQKENRS